MTERILHSFSKTRCIYLSDTSPALEKPGKYLKTPFRRQRSIYTHVSGAGEALIYTYLAPVKPEKYFYTPQDIIYIPRIYPSPPVLPLKTKMSSLQKLLP